MSVEVNNYREYIKEQITSAMGAVSFLELPESYRTPIFQKAITAAEAARSRFIASVAPDQRNGGRIKGIGQPIKDAIDKVIEESCYPSDGTENIVAEPTPEPVKPVETPKPVAAKPKTEPLPETEDERSGQAEPTPVRARTRYDAMNGSQLKAQLTARKIDSPKVPTDAEWEDEARRLLSADDETKAKSAKNKK